MFVANLSQGLVGKRLSAILQIGRSSRAGTFVGFRYGRGCFWEKPPKKRCGIRKAVPNEV